MIINIKEWKDKCKKLVAFQEKETKDILYLTITANSILRYTIHNFESNSLFKRQVLIKYHETVKGNLILDDVVVLNSLKFDWLTKRWKKDTVDYSVFR